MMTYDEYRQAVSGAEQNYTMLFETEEQRARFLEAIRAGGEAIKELYACRNELCLLCGKYQEAHITGKTTHSVMVRAYVHARDREDLCVNKNADKMLMND